MRFDDRIATVLALPERHASARAAKWRQLVDLIAQRREAGPSPELDQAFSYLRRHRSEVEPATRSAVARSLAGRRVAPQLIGFFADDQASVAAPLIAGAHLSTDEWLAIMPGLGPSARALLRNRRDLSPEVMQALASFGSTDFVLPGEVAAEAPAAPPLASVEGGAQGGPGQIRELVARIEEFRKHREEIKAVPPPTPAEAVESFRWETGSDGVILWVEGAPRGPLIGQGIASIAELGQHGVDGQAAGAYEKRAPFRDARLSVAGQGAVSGDWRISGVPFFDYHSGSFLGYRGTARRPRLDEVARADSWAKVHGVFGTDLPADSLRQLIHELRTPLNAIVGFAQMIEGQYMGPAGEGYRTRAAEIMEQAGRLLSAIDDLDTAARIETSKLTLAEQPVDAVALLWRLHDAYERVASIRGARIAIEIARDLPPAKVELGAAERMFARILAATIGLAGEGETISAAMTMGQLGPRSMLCFQIDRPAAIAGREPPALLDPGYSPDGDWPAAPALGLGFSLRLVRNLAEAVGGALVIGTERFMLYLPSIEQPELSTGQTN